MKYQWSVLSYLQNLMLLYGMLMKNSVMNGLEKSILYSVGISTSIPLCLHILYMCQYCAKSVPHQEVLACFGCLTWKQVNTVMQFTEQKCMDADPEYTHAILNLCKGICN